MDSNDPQNKAARWQTAGPASVEFPRRRLGRIVHDERGQASMEWERVTPGERDAPKRVALSIVEDESPTARMQRLSSSATGVNPYDRGIETRAQRADRARRPSDMRKLDEWIRQKRAVEALRNQRED